MVVDPIFVKLSIILVIALVVSIFIRLLKQHMLIGYIITGILVSPYFFDIASSVDSIETFSHMGVAVLLFMVGLNLNPKVIKKW
jgi:Kef-type K+ transport system membrane component KefB